MRNLYLFTADVTGRFPLVFSALRVFEAFSFSDFQQIDLSKIDRMLLGILDLPLGFEGTECGVGEIV